MTAPSSDALVLFGVTGDLAHKMTFPALYAMAKKGALQVPVIGVALPKWSPERLRKRVTEQQRSGGIDNQRAFRHLLSQLKYVGGDYQDRDTFTALKKGGVAESRVGANAATSRGTLGPPAARANRNARR
jgi:glucose-6-phosphate 1-dehydrogenase